MKKRVAKPQAVVTVRTKALGKAPEEKTFFLKDGRKLTTLYELIDELETMNDGVFNDYVNDMKNDFASWVEGVFGEKPLADEMRSIRNRMDTQRAVLKHVVRELKKLGGN